MQTPEIRVTLSDENGLREVALKELDKSRKYIVDTDDGKGFTGFFPAMSPEEIQLKLSRRGYSSGTIIVSPYREE